MISNDKYFIERFERDIIGVAHAPKISPRFSNPYIISPLGFIPIMESKQLKHPFEIVHYYYNIDDLAEAVFHRSSMLGKFRPNKEGEHQLDIVALTPDERADFDVHCKRVATEVFDKLIAFAVKGRKCFMYNEDNYVHVTENMGAGMTYADNLYADDGYRHDTWTLHLPTPDATKKMTAAQILMALDSTLTLTTALAALASDYAVSLSPKKARAYVNKFISKGIVAYTTPDDTGTETRGYKYLSITATFTDTTVLNNTMAVEVDVTYKYRIQLWNGETEIREAHTKQLFNAELINNGAITMKVLLPIKIDETTSSVPGLPEERIIDLEYYSIDRCALVSLFPTELNRGDAVQYEDADGNITFLAALKDTDTSAPMDDSTLFTETYDYRNTVHYILKKPLYILDDSVTQVDNTIPETIVNGVMYYWSQVVSPADTNYYGEQYNKLLNELRERLNANSSMQVVAHPF